jgi:hypothetical protein
MAVDVADLQQRAKDLRFMLEAICARVPEGFSTPEANQFFSVIHELAIDTIEAVEFLSAGGDTIRLNARATGLAIRVAAVTALYAGKPVDSFTEQACKLATDVHDALIFQAEVSEAVAKAIDGDPA